MNNADNATCAGDGECFYAAACVDKPTTPQIDCYLSTTKDACVAEAPGCFWFSYSENVCGEASPTITGCYPCDTVMSGGLFDVRGQLSRKAGQTCTWTAVAPYTQKYSATVNSFTMGTNARCTALNAKVSDDQDLKDLTTALTAQGNIAATAVGTCAAAAPSASSLVSPSLGVLAVVAFLARM
jgi:hypothetical protein